MNYTSSAKPLLLVWLGLVGTGGVASVWLGAPPRLAALLAGLLLAPGLISLAARAFTPPDGSPRQPPGALQRLAAQHEGAIWAVCIAGVAAITGGALSPLGGLLLLVPVVALIEGDRQRAGDAAIVGLIAYTGLLVADQFVTLPALSPWAWPLAAAPIAASLIWVLASALTAGAPEAATSGQGTTARGPLGPPPQRVWTDLDPDGPVCAIQLTALGRVKTVSGNAGLLPPLKTGQLAELMVAAPGRAAFAKRLRQGGEARLNGPGGRPIRLFIRPGSDATMLVAVPALGEAAAIARAEADGDAAIKARNTFFASLSHDLKTPLNAILGFADMMRAEIKGPLPDAYRDYAQIIHESGEDLLLLVDDIMDLAKADADRQTLDIEPIDLGAIGRSVMRQLEAQAQRRNVRLDLHADSEAWAMADARAVRQIWQNLLSNAVKYSNPGETVRLSALAIGDRVELAVEDDGAGMDEADLAAIAEPFTQGKNASGRPGTGLGLTVVKRFAELMDASIAIESAKGAGTRVRISFPPADPADYAPLEDAAE